MSARPDLPGRGGGAFIALLLAAALSGCGGDGATFSRYGDLARLAAVSVAGEPEREPREREIGRDVLELFTGPTIALSFEDSGRTFMSADARTEGYLSYQDRNRRGLRMKGGAVAGTFGFGVDLLAVRHQREDPIARPTPLADWPGQIDREYQYRLRDLENYSIVVTCVFDRVVRERIEIVERTYETVRVVETCTNQRRSFENTYWVDPLTGIIWRSHQWTGPSIRSVTIETIRPDDDA